MNEQEAVKRIDAAIQPPEELEGSLCTGWVLVAEFDDGEGAPWLCRMLSPGMSSWKSRGMVTEVWDSAGEDSP